MKTKKDQLDVDFVGGQGSLTPAEEKALNDYFVKKKASKLNSKKGQNSIRKTSINNVVKGNQTATLLPGKRS